MALISVTRLRVRSWRYLPGFFYYAFRSAAQARGSEGNLGVALFNDARRAFWTKSAWRDEAALRAFLLAEPHKTAMKKLADWCDEAAVVHWTQESAALPGWQEAHLRMVAEGRRSRVRYPSPAHEAFTIPAPRS
jgi:heme-degrading monooxygenase HmoA